MINEQSKEKIEKVVSLEAKGKTLAEASDALDISRERVRQIFTGETGEGWGISRKKDLLSAEAVVISEEIVKARKNRDKKALLEATLAIQDYATKRSWLIAEASHAWNTLLPYGGFVLLSKIVKLSAGTLSNYANVYIKYGKLAKKYPRMNFSFFSNLASRTLTEEQAEDLLKMAKEEELTVPQFSNLLTEMFTEEKHNE